jgi:hypothetical protein
MKLGWSYGLLFDFTRKTSETDIWHRLGKLYNDLHTDRLIENIKYKLIESEKPHIITEGKTDWKHIESARTKMSPDLLLSYPSSEDTLGDVGLLKMCDNLSKFGARGKNKTIAIFDRDNPDILKKLKNKGDIDTYQYWGNNIYSIVLPVPVFRKQYKNISIEMLYKEVDLSKKDAAGKRLYFDNELKKEIMPDRTVTYIPIKPLKSTEFEKKVYDGLATDLVENGTNPALSKAHFADNVKEGIEEYKNFNFSGFKPLLNLLDKILEDRPND